MNIEEEENMQIKLNKEVILPYFCFKNNFTFFKKYLYYKEYILNFVKMKKLFLFLFLLLCWVSTSFAQPQFSFTWTVSSISDWDTIWAYTWSNEDNAFKIRLLGFDTPESYLWEIKDYKFYGCWVSASNYAKKHIEIGKTYEFYLDDLAKEEDIYGRKLRFLKLATWDLTSTWTYWYSILTEGLANFYQYENQTFSWVYEQIDNENKILGKWMYNAFCKAQDEYIKENGKREWWEIQVIIDQVIKWKNNFHYQLQNANFDELKTLTNSVIFLEKDDINLTPDEVSQLKANWNILIWYISIWEAEIRRDYWNDEWVDEDGNLTDKAPSWLGEKNPNWDSYRVKFWEDGWKDIVFSRIDELKKAWYDGILLDVVDVYSYWQNDAPDDEKVADADDKMVDFVADIRKHLWDYLAIIPNQWFELVNKTWYLNLINWILTESLFSENNKERPEEDKSWQLQYLDKVYEAGKQVFDIDYIKDNNDLVCAYYDYIAENWFLWAVYNLWLDSFDKIKCEYTTNLAKEYWILSQWTDSSYYYYQPVENIVDWDISTYNHTSAENDENWLQVYIPGLIWVTKITVTSRQDYPSRLEGAKVYVQDHPYDGNLDDAYLVATLKWIADKQEFTYLPSKKGKYIIIKAADWQNLHITELEVFGYAVQNPVFNDYKTYLLVPQGLATGSLISNITAVDYQKDTITYLLSGSDLDFTIDASWNIVTSWNLKDEYIYKFNVIAEDTNWNQTISDLIEYETTSKQAVENALNSWIVTKVTKSELLDASLNELNAYSGADFSSDDIDKITTLINHLKNRDYNFDWWKCKDSSGNYWEDYDDCSEVPGLTELQDTLTILRNRFAKLDISKIDAFKTDDYKLEKLLILLADKIREEVKFPMDKVKTDDNVFVDSYFADSVVYNYREIAPAQSDMWNFSRSVFTWVDLVTKKIELNSKFPFKSAWVYALPGQTFKVTRLDDSDLDVSIFVNSLRPWSTHEFEKDGYKRPKYLQSSHISVWSWETIYFTSVYWGPIQVAFSKANLPVKLKFKNVAEHPYWNWPEDNDIFAQKIDEGKFDWAEISTPGFEVHSKLDKMKESIQNWGSAQTLAEATMHYISNFPLVLAWYQGPWIDKVDEIWDFANENNLEIKYTDTVKHMNADQATCWYGCSGNPYDAYWAFNPIWHWDIHEVGHSLERTRFLLSWFVLHSITNPYAFYTLTQYNKETGNNLYFHTLDFEELFNILKQSKTEDDLKAFLQEKINNSGDRNIQFRVYIQMIMHAQKYWALQDGWDLWARLHVLEKNINDVKADWENKKASLWFSNYTLDEFENISNNDWMLVSMSYAAKLDYRPLFDMYGQDYSEKASEQVESFGFPKAKQTYFVSTPEWYVTKDKYGDYLDKPDMEIYSYSVWPENIDDCPYWDKSPSKIDGTCEAPVEDDTDRPCYNENWYCNNWTWEKIGKCSWWVQRVWACDMNAIYRMSYDSFTALSSTWNLITEDIDTIYDNTSVKRWSTKELIEDTPYGKAIKINTVPTKARDRITLPIDVSNAKKWDVLFVEYYIKPLSYDNDFSGATFTLDFTNGYLIRYAQTFPKLNEWKHVYFPVYLKDITADTYYLYITSVKRAEFEIAGFSVRNYWNVDYFKVPVSSEYYAWEEDDAAWRKDILEKIKQVRTKPVTIKVVDKRWNPIKNSKLKIQQLSHSFRIGWTVNWAYRYGNRWDDETSQANMQEYFDTFDMLYNDLIFPNSLKWVAINKESFIDYVFWKVDEYWFSVRWHNVIWPKETTIPASVVEEYNNILENEWEEKANEYLSWAIHDRIVDAISKYKWKIYEWDVINEPNDGGYVWSKIWTGAMLDWLKLARQTDPNLNIAINEYWLTNRVDDGFAEWRLEIFKQLIDDNADFDTIWTQTRYYWIMSMTALKQRLDLITSLGKEVSITETEFWIFDEQTQGKLARDLTLMILSYPQVRSIDFWTWNQHDASDFYGLKAFFTKDGYAKPIAKELYDLFYKQFWVDTEVSLDSWEYTFNPFFGEYKVVWYYDGKETSKILNIQKDDNTNEYIITLDVDLTPLVHSGWGWWGGGGGWRIIPTCIDEQLICKKSWNTFKWYRKDGVSCKNWNLWKICSLEDNEKIKEKYNKTFIANSKINYSKFKKQSLLVRQLVVSKKKLEKNIKYKKFIEKIDKKLESLSNEKLYKLYLKIDKIFQSNKSSKYKNILEYIQAKSGIIIYDRIWEDIINNSKQKKLENKKETKKVEGDIIKEKENNDKLEKNNYSKLKKQSLLVRQLVVSKKKLEKNIKYKKFIEKIDKKLESLSNEKLYKLYLKIEGILNLSKTKKYKDILEYIQAKSWIIIYKRK